jgi:ribosomal protein S18 acetylase RimI-like enzyme
MRITDAYPVGAADQAQRRDVELVVLRDGSRVTVRAATSRDEPALRTFLSGLCPEARRLRFFSGAADMTLAAHLVASTDPTHYGLVAHDEIGVLVGHAIYAELDATRAEIAVEVADHLNRRGLGTILIQRLATTAERRNVTHFIAEVRPENRAMLDLFRDWFDAHITFHEGSDTVEFPTSAWRLARERFNQSLELPGTTRDRERPGTRGVPAGRLPENYGCTKDTP